MSLLETWKKLELEKLEQPFSIVGKLPMKSNHPVVKMKRSYFVKVAFSVAFLIIALFLTGSFDDVFIRVGMSIVSFSYVVFLWLAFSMYRKIKVEFPMDQPLKNALAQTIEMIETNLKLEERAALIVYPFACASGFLMGFQISGGNVSDIFTDRLLSVLLLVTIMVLTPICYATARWMNKITYGKCLLNMKEMIEELEGNAGL